MKGDEMQSKLTQGGGKRRRAIRAPGTVPDNNPDLRQSWGFLNGENPHAPGNFY